MNYRRHLYYLLNLEKRLTKYIKVVFNNSVKAYKSISVSHSKCLNDNGTYLKPKV